MKIVGKNMSMIRGDTEGFAVSEKVNGVARPFVDGDTVYFTVKVNTRTTDKALQKVITSFVDGKALIGIAPEDTGSLNPGKYVYDVQITFADGTKKTIIGPSDFTISAEVTYE